MNSTTLHRSWLGLVALVASSLLGTAFSRPSVNTVERERLLQAATSALDSLPQTIGGWRSQAGPPLSDELGITLGCRTYQSRIFTNERTGERVSLLWLAGSAGPLATLPPQAFYEQPQLAPVDSGKPERLCDSATFLKVTLQSGAERGRNLTTYAACRKFRGNWEAPASSGLTWGAQPMLFRLQVATEASAAAAGDGSVSDPCRNFLNELLPAIEDILISN